MTRTLTSRTATLVIVTALALAGCSSTPAREDRPTITPATPAVSPESAMAPAGQVVPAAAGEGLAFDPVSRRLAAISGNAIVLYTVDGGLREVARVDTGERANQVVPRGKPGGFLVAVKDGVLTISGDKRASTEKVDGDVLTVATEDGPDAGGARTLTGTATGDIVVGRPGGQTTITGPVEASQLLVHGNKAAVIDRRQASLTEVNVDGGKTDRSLRVARGVTNAAIDDYGRIFAVDTGENQLVGYTIDPFMERFLYPVAGSPWAVDYDESAKLVWLSLTATNEVVGYALGSGMPVEKQRHATVRQPDAIAVDPQTGTLYVQSATGGGIQAIPTR